MEEQEKTRQPRRFKTVSAEAFQNTMKALSIAQGELAEAIGYSQSAAAEWLKNGIMPYSASLACEALRRRNGIKTTAVVKVSRNVPEPVSDNVKVSEIAPGIWLMEL